MRQYACWIPPSSDMRDIADSGATIFKRPRMPKAERVPDDWMAGYGVEPTLERPSDDVIERLLMANPVLC
jgi:hypothetical protein